MDGPGLNVAWSVESSDRLETHIQMDMFSERRMLHIQMVEDGVCERDSRMTIIRASSAQY